jgi:hypothetical protein
MSETKKPFFISPILPSLREASDAAQQRLNARNEENERVVRVAAENQRNAIADGAKSHGDLAVRTLDAAKKWRSAALKLNLGLVAKPRWGGYDVSYVELPFVFLDPHATWGEVSGVSIRWRSEGFEAGGCEIRTSNDLVRFSKRDLERLFKYFTGKEAWEDLELLFLLKE